MHFSESTISALKVCLDAESLCSVHLYMPLGNYKDPREPNPFCSFSDFINIRFIKQARMLNGFSIRLISNK